MTITDREKAYWVAFTKVKGIGPVRFQKLCDHFGTAEKAWNASAVQLAETGLGSKTIQAIQMVKNEIDVVNEYDSILEKGIYAISSNENNYPKRLREITYPPFILFMKGDITAEDQWAIAVVGTRQKTNYGRQVTIDLCSFLARNGLTIVSGLARGIDAIAHQAALDAGGRTLAVFGSGVDLVYPPENRNLAAKIIENGALISEYPPGTEPDAINFPPRNRIISGLSMATIIIEAGKKSGALITATFATDQGREVFSVPGSIYAPKSKGTNKLIQNGARLLVRFDEILEVLNLKQIEKYAIAQKILPANQIEETIMVHLENDSMHIDEIQSITGIPIDRVSASLVMMELKGLVRQVSNMTYSAIQEEEGIYGRK